MPTFAETGRHFPLGTCDVFISKSFGIRQEILQHIAPLVQHSIANGLYPGAVVLASHNGRIIYRGVFGNRRVVPDVAPMRFDTIFDIASLTKVLVTTTAAMQLVERGQLDLDTPVAHYWPGFATNGKAAVTVRQLLTHTSGLPAEVCFAKEDRLPDYAEKGIPKYISGAAFHSIEKEKLLHPPGSTFIYSDGNFVALGHVVEMISHTPLATYAKQNIFNPLGMSRTYYLPPNKLKEKIAPTEVVDGKLRWGEVHDSTATLMGGVSGMAGVFSTAKDLGTFADCLLNDGRIKWWNKHLLGPLAIHQMTSRQTPPWMPDVRGLGWDINSRYANRSTLFAANSYGHTGYTGTSLWIDPTHRTWVLILTSRTHPTPVAGNPLIHDRKAIADIVAGSLINT